MRAEIDAYQAEQRASIDPLRNAGVNPLAPSMSDVVVAHGNFLDTLAAGRLRHAGQPKLTDAVRAGTQRPMGGAVGWARRGEQVDGSPLRAATLGMLGVDESATRVEAVDCLGMSRSSCLPVGAERRRDWWIGELEPLRALIPGLIGWRLLYGVDTGPAASPRRCLR